jgi:hypothetical protein
MSSPKVVVEVSAVTPQGERVRLPRISGAPKCHQSFNALQSVCNIAAGKSTNAGVRNAWVDLVAFDCYVEYCVAWTNQQK